MRRFAWCMAAAAALTGLTGTPAEFRTELTARGVAVEVVEMKPGKPRSF